MQAADIPKRTAVALIVGLTTACSAIEGYPTDPLNNAATLASLQNKYFSDTAEADYDRARGDERQALRDRIVYARIQAYDIHFSQFQRALNANANTINVGADIIGVALGGLGAVIADAATKSALAAASAGVLGAQGAINKDLYYQKTVAALIAQMEANRDEAKAAILLNLKLPDAVYPLRRAYVDLSGLNDAGSLPAAISVITQKADAAKAEAQAKIQQTVKLTYSTSSSTKLLDEWLSPDGIPNVKRMKALQDWLDKNYRNSNIPAAGLAGTDDAKGLYEAIRKKALADKQLMDTATK